MPEHSAPQHPTYSLHGVVDGKDLHLTGIEDAFQALAAYREIVGTGKVGALKILYGDEVITFDQLRRLGGNR